MANPPAGWHPDPLSRHAQRYWDGQQWTEHVADESGNMSTDPLDGGGQQQQQGQAEQGGWGQATQQQDTAGWGQQQADSSPSWGQGDTAATDSGASWGDASATSSTEPSTPTGDWVSSRDTTGTGGWGATGAAAAGAAAASTGSGTDTDADAGADTAGDDAGDGAVPVDAGIPAGDVDGFLPTVDQPGLVSIDVADGVVVRHGSLVARSSGVSGSDSAHPGALDLTGSGTAHVAAGGRAVAVLEVPVGGLTVRNDALLAHSGGLERAAAADGIVGYDATDVTGTGWVALAAPGGVLELSPVGGLDVTTSALVAWSSDLDVSHADDVNLNGRGIVLVSAETP